MSEVLSPRSWSYSRYTLLHQRLSKPIREEPAAALHDALRGVAVAPGSGKALFAKAN